MSLREIKSEELRILYVALTRAKEKLIIFGNINDYEKSTKNDIAIYDENGKIDAALILKNNNYLKNILISLKKYNESEKLFCINVIKFDKEKFESINIEKNNEENINIETMINKLKCKIDYNVKNDDKKIQDVLNDNLNYNYQYYNDVITSNRVSVSKLKSEYVAENISSINTQNNKLNIEEVSINDFVDEKYIIDKFKIPKSLSKDNKYTPVRKGTH